MAYWVYKRSGRVVTKAEEPRRVRPSREERLERRRRHYARLKERRKEEARACVKFRCRYLDNCKQCVSKVSGYCAKDGQRCKRFGSDGTIVVLGDPNCNPFDIVNWSGLFGK